MMGHVKRQARNVERGWLVLKNSTKVTAVAEQRHFPAELS